MAHDKFNKVDFIDHLVEARRNLMTTTEAIPSHSTNIIFLGVWTILDLLAHLIGWDRTNLTSCQDIILGKIPDFYNYYDKDWARYNSILISQYKVNDFNLMLELLNDSHRQLVTFLELLPEESYTKDYGVRIKSYKLTIERLIKAEVKDELKHEIQIYNFLRSIQESQTQENSPDEINQLMDDLLQEMHMLTQRNTPNMRIVRKKYSNLLVNFPPEKVLLLAYQLIRITGLRWIAYELVSYHPDAYYSLNRDKIEALGQGMSGWEEVDAFARTLSGPAWKDRILQDDTIISWAESDNLWWQRASLVSTVALNMRSQGGKGDPTRTLAICEVFVNNKDDTIIKALSWALRALVPCDPKSVEKFLEDNESILAVRVKREVRNKLTTGLKNPLSIGGRN